LQEDDPGFEQLVFKIYSHYRNISILLNNMYSLHSVFFLVVTVVTSVKMFRFSPLVY